MSLHIQLEKFEGPLGLLLFLIRREEMDIFDINIHQITQQYLEYIRTMKDLDLEMAGDFVAMAATLIQIKSRMLLPQYNEAGEVVESEDPRRELVARLLEYQMYQEAAQRLAQLPWVNRDLWLRGVREEIPRDKEDEILIDEGGLYALIGAYRRAMQVMQKKIHRVMAKAQSIAERVLEIRPFLKVGSRLRLVDLVDSDGVKRPREQKVLITFLSLLELAKLGFVSLFQTQTYGDIHVETKREIQEDVITRVEEFEIDREALVNQMFATPPMGSPRVSDSPVAEALSGDSLAGDGGDSIEFNADLAHEDSDHELAPLTAEVGGSEWVSAATDDEISEEERRLDLHEDGPETIQVGREVPLAVIAIDISEQPLQLTAPSLVGGRAVSEDQRRDDEAGDLAIETSDPVDSESRIESRIETGVEV